MMKQLMLILTVLACLQGNAQQLFFEAFSGYNITAYETVIGDNQGYVPLGFRVAGGLEHLQIGGEYRRNITNPSFQTGDSPFRTEFEETYYGALLRGNISSLPAYRFGLIIKAGAGYYQGKEMTFENNILVTDNTIEFDKIFGWNAGLGISAPIASLVHWEIGYQYNAVNRDSPGSTTEKQRFGYHSFQMGLSLNLVFGNTAKKCRRVISSKRGR